MENYSKKEIVDFVCEFYAANGRRISRKKLNAIPKEKLVDCIKCDPELEILFAGYIERKHKMETESKRYTEELLEFVKRLVDEPDSSSAESNLLDFIDNLPVGVIPRATLARIKGLILPINSLVGIKLIEYGLRIK